ncbi:MAG: glucose-6-phosphate dehydrogenase assembly protein OpcA [bacterium]
MMTTSDQQTQLLGAPKEVDVVAIERELVSLWKNASEGMAADGSSTPVMRACSLNFIVVTEDEHEADELATLAGEVTIEHPARIFLITANRRNGTPKLEAWISARCSLPVPGGKQVCCEQINLTAQGDEASKVPSIVTSLLVSDVPSVLLWKIRFDLNDGMLQSLTHVVDRVLIDSSEDAAPEPSLRAWYDFIARHNKFATFGDLAWTHLTPWRSLVANAFNPSEVRHLLGSIDNIEIEYSSTAEPRHSGISQALLLTGWLAQKLHWIPVKQFQKSDRGEYTAKLRLGEQAINIRIRKAEPRKDFPGGIESITIHTVAGPTLRFNASEHRDCVRTLHDGVGTSSEELLPALSDKSEAQLVAQELELVHRDSGYEAVLERLTGLLGS